MWNPFKPKNTPPPLPAEGAAAQEPALEHASLPPVPARGEHELSPDKRQALFDEDLLAVAQADAAKASGEPKSADESARAVTAIGDAEPAQHADPMQHAEQDKPARAKKGLPSWLPRFGKAEKGHKPEIRPIRVLMGYLPEVSARDAKEYAQGIAEKHFEQMGLVFFGAFPYDNGFVFEVHEGGEGKAFAPEILKHFEALGPYQVGEQHTVCIQTATRVLEVQRGREGLAAILLPENSPTRGDDWLTPTKALTPAMDRRDKVFYTGAAIFATGFVAVLLSGTVFRLQLQEEPAPPKPRVVSASTLPMSQWSRVQALPENAYVRALRYKNGRWEAPEIQTEAVSPPSGAPVVPGAPIPVPDPGAAAVPGPVPTPTPVPAPAAPKP